MKFEAGDIVWVVFPHVATNRAARRPALIVSHTGLGPNKDLVWVIMITSASRSAWPGDIIIDDFAGRGLPIASKIRTEKIMTLDAGGAQFVGKLTARELDTVRERLSLHLGAPC